MSGAGAVDPTNANADAAVAGAPAPALPSCEPRSRFLSFRQLNALAVAVVLASTGMVSPADVSFAAFSLPYLYLLSSSFPPISASSPAPVFGQGNLLLSAYVSAGAVIGLLLPIGYILHGVLAGDKEGINAAAPHVFLLACQIFMEGVTFTRRFSLPMRAFVPIFFNAKRLLSISEWMSSEIFGKDKEEVGSGMRVRVSVGRGLAVVNMIFWGFNLFGFLLPVYLPRALKRHYGVDAKF